MAISSNKYNSLQFWNILSAKENHVLIIVKISQANKMDIVQVENVFAIISHM